MHADTDANVLVWETLCTLVPQNAAYMKVTMGDVADFYKPTEDDAADWCGMLKNNNKHRWYLKTHTGPPIPDIALKNSHSLLHSTNGTLLYSTHLLHNTLMYKRVQC